MLRIEDGRILLGAFALVLTGMILSVMVYLYISGYYGLAAISLSRWWWEIIMNFQILAIGCIWFCYANLIQDSTPKIACLMRIRFFVALFGIMIPFWIVLVSVIMDWFTQPPPSFVLDYLLAFMLVLWVVSTIIPRVSQLRAYKQDISLISLIPLWNAGKAIHLIRIAPLFMLLMVVMYDAVMDTSYYYYCMPVLMYLQSAVPYFRKGMGWGKPSPVLV